MKIDLGSKKMAEKMLSPEDVIREQLNLAHAIHPGYLMPNAVLLALEEAGYTVVSHEDLDREIALAHQAGEESASERG